MALDVSTLRIVLANGSLATYPQGGGHWTVFLQYLFGLDALGHDWFWLELLKSSGDDIRDRRLIRVFLSRFARYGFADRCAVLLVKGDLDAATLDEGAVHGTSAVKLRDIIRHADLLWNFCCTVREPLLSRFSHRVLVDLDPGLIQIPALTYDMGIDAHQTLLTVGRNVGHPDCQVPTLGRDWHAFLPFVHLPAWRRAPDPTAAAPFSSVTQWTWDEIWHDGRVLSASKRQAYMRYVDVPRRAQRPFELAANIHPKDTSGDRERLLSEGWQLSNPHRVARTPERYQAFIARSRAEFSCPKPIYRELNSGWLSDRSAAYLASGRPVVTEDTGFSRYLPTGVGLLRFSDVDGALESVAAVDADYETHACAARDLAATYLAADKCLPSMLAACGF